MKQNKVMKNTITLSLTASLLALLTPGATVQAAAAQTATEEIQAGRAMLKTDRKVSVAEAVSGVQAAGYRSKSKSFPKIVGRTLSRDKRFKRVGRGVYALRG